MEAFTKIAMKRPAIYRNGTAARIVEKADDRRALFSAIAFPRALDQTAARTASRRLGALRRGLFDRKPGTENCAPVPAPVKGGKWPPAPFRP